MGIEITISRENLATHDRLISVISSEKLNKTSFLTFAGIPVNKVAEVKKGKTKLTDEQIIALKSEINKFRIELKTLIADLEKFKTTSSITETKFRKFIDKKYIKPAVVFNKDTYSKFDGWKLKRRGFPDEVKQQIIDSLSLLIIETNV